MATALIVAALLTGPLVAFALVVRRMSDDLERIQTPTTSGRIMKQGDCWSCDRNRATLDQADGLCSTCRTGMSVDT